MKDFFTNDLVEMLGLDDDYTLAEVNHDIFHLILNVRETIKDELVNILLNNQEVLTSQRIVLDGKQVDATVANWLNYFISQKGSAMFDTLTLSDFITSSPNAKFLDFDEKRLVSNLLMVYRNLKFFPESLTSPDPKHWVIFPVSSVEEPLTKTVDSEANEVIDLTEPTLTVPVAKPKVFPKAPAPLTPEVEAKEALKAEQIAETEALIARYPSGSIERMALEEELDKLRK